MRSRSGETPPASVSAPHSAEGVPTAAPSGAKAAATAAPADAWYLGAWTGTYESRTHRIDLPSKQGGLPQWATDDERRGAGRGTLAVSAGPDGVAGGAATGPLGDQYLRGAFDGDTLAARLTPKETDATAFSGTLVAHRDGNRITGTLQAATADGSTTRAAKLTLSRSSSR